MSEFRSNQVKRSRSDSIPREAKRACPTRRSNLEEPSTIGSSKRGSSLQDRFNRIRRIDGQSSRFVITHGAYDPSARQYSLILSESLPRAKEENLSEFNRLSSWRNDTGFHDTIKPIILTLGHMPEKGQPNDGLSFGTDSKVVQAFRGDPADHVDGNWSVIVSPRDNDQDESFGQWYVGRGPACLDAFQAKFRKIDLAFENYSRNYHNIKSESEDGIQDLLDWHWYTLRDKNRPTSRQSIDQTITGWTEYYGSQHTAWNRERYSMNHWDSDKGTCDFESPPEIDDYSIENFDVILGEEHLEKPEIKRLLEIADDLSVALPVGIGNACNSFSAWSSLPSKGSGVSSRIRVEQKPGPDVDCERSSVYYLDSLRTM